MTSITIITIVVVAILTIVILGLTWLGYSSCIKAYQFEVKAGQHDKEIVKEYDVKKSKKGLIGAIASYSVLTLLISLFITGIVYKARGENLIINNQTALVIKSGSMADFYNESTAESLNHDRSLQFDIGDICFFEDNFKELVVGEVYGYQHKDVIITHRLIDVDYESSLCTFKGDNNSVADSFIPINRVVYHYTGNKIVGVGVFILYAQSFFGLWSLMGITTVVIGSEVVYYKLGCINKSRLYQLKKGNAYEN